MNLIELALGLELVSDSMATTRWQPPWETEDALAALDRVRAALLAGDVDVSAVMRQRSASEKDRVPGVVVAFSLRPFSGRRKRRQLRSAERAAAFRARCRAEAALAVARAAGADCAEALSALPAAVSSVPGAPLTERPESADARAAAETFAKVILAQDPNSGLRLDRLPGRGVELLLTGAGGYVGARAEVAVQAGKLPDERVSWGVLCGLQQAAHRNGQMVRVGAPRRDGRIVTERPVRGEEIAVRATNLRTLLTDYAGFSVGDVVGLDDYEVTLLGFDSAACRWAGRTEPRYLWLPQECVSQNA